MIVAIKLAVSKWAKARKSNLLRPFFPYTLQSAGFPLLAQSIRHTKAILVQKPRNASIYERFLHSYESLQKLNSRNQIVAGLRLALCLPAKRTCCTLSPGYWTKITAKFRSLAEIPNGENRLFSHIGPLAQ